MPTDITCLSESSDGCIMENNKRNNMKEKQNKKASVPGKAALVGVGTMYGAGFGASRGFGSKKSNKTLERALNIGKESLARNIKNSKDVDSLSRLLEDPDMNKIKGAKEGIKKKIEEKIKASENNRARSDKAFKIAKKTMRNNTIKGGLKGAVIGAGIAGGIAAGINLAKKKKQKEYSYKIKRFSSTKS